jgi:hypothetical protein
MTRKFSLIAVAFGVATALFGARMLTSPPVSEAAMSPGIDVGKVEFNAPKNLSSFDDKYQRGTGVLDIFVGRWESRQNLRRRIMKRYLALALAALLGLGLLSTSFAAFTQDAYGGIINSRGGYGSTGGYQAYTR